MRECVPFSVVNTYTRGMTETGNENSRGEVGRRAGSHTATDIFAGAGKLEDVRGRFYADRAIDKRPALQRDVLWLISEVERLTALAHDLRIALDGGEIRS